MAVCSARGDDEAKRRVVVKDVPPGVSEKDLAIHFLRRMNGGGQVESVEKEGESAVVTFESMGGM